MHLEAAGCRATIDATAGGRLTSFTIDDREILVQEGRDIYHSGSFVMAPWVGRLRNGEFSWKGRDYDFPRNAEPHALHGLVTQASWEPAGPGTVAIDLPQPWPWRGRLTHSISVEADRAEFRLELRVEEPMPAALGWHPWFLRHVSGPDGSTTGPVRLDAQPGHMYGNDETGLPTGQLVPPVGLPWDYAFVDFPAPPRVIWPGFLELSVESSCPIYVLYDWEPQGICIEPWTAPPNSLNMPDHLVVTPDQPLIATMAWRWRRLGPEVTL